MEFLVEDGFRQIQVGKAYWNSFIEKSNFEFGVMRILPGQIDNQNPHASDEVYFILEGNGIMEIGNHEYEINQGKIFYVEKGIHHKFKDNSETIIAYYALN